LFECFKGLERRKAAGVDGRTKESYADMEIKQEIHKLVQSMKNNTYRLTGTLYNRQVVQRY